MAHEIIALLAQYGLILVFLNVLVEQAGAPVPAVPTLVVAGALAANGQLPLVGVLGVALLACLISDLAWYWAGRRFGSGVMRTICRVSLSPDSCVKQSELHFQRWRGQVLLVAKFVPGLSTVAPPLVGALGLRPAAFLWLDGLGSLLWLGVAVGLGYVLAPEIDKVLAALGNAGTIALELVGSLLALYILAKWWQRRRLLVSLRMARITVDELAQAIEKEPLPVLVDVRSQAARMVDTRIIPGALLSDLGSIDLTLQGVPLEAELIIYCNCPNEASAAMAAKRLMEQGYRRVRPLLGGLDAWEAAGYTIHRLAPVDTDTLGGNLPTQNAA
ncbi:membrane protein DedA, SNARE-associated domain [Dyella sp. OK004]|uniref:DedA family protein/thiosulfate sulfurtransferase GlpE n=1 Tax=Dyella sp. OK004 TaxID=1855292 RepID=UPI0008E3964E|nr:DedA family protein/thiosulfate sulfurtransferase GlpE [Dyella sp. OK004]SFR89691.1 membrane protein DedA, SNARE-associated domain [Dyella sp. OK004]